MDRPRILHLIDPATPGGGACTLRFLAEAVAYVPDLEHDVIILGTRAHGALARRCGVVIDGVICPPVRKPVFARKALMNAVRRREIERGPYARVHAWTLPAARLAAFALPDRPRIATPTVGPFRGEILLLGGCRSDRCVGRATRVFAATTGVADGCAAIGVARHELRVLTPAANGVARESAAGSERRASLRERWGVADEAFVVAAIAEPASWADAMAAGRILVRLAASGRSPHLLVHHGAAHRVEAERWVGPSGLRDRLIIDDAAAEPWAVHAGVDAVLAFTAGDRRQPRRPEGGILPVLQAMAAGVPVLAEETESVRAVIPDDGTGLVVAPGDVNSACAALARLYDDRPAGRVIGARGAARARAAFGFDAYRARLLEAYGLS